MGTEAGPVMAEPEWWWVGWERRQRSERVWIPLRSCRISGNLLSHPFSQFSYPKDGMTVIYPKPLEQRLILCKHLLSWFFPTTSKKLNACWLPNWPYRWKSKLLNQRTKLFMIWPSWRVQPPFSSARPLLLCSFQFRKLPISPYPWPLHLLSYCASSWKADTHPRHGSPHCVPVTRLN